MLRSFVLGRAGYVIQRNQSKHLHLAHHGQAPATVTPAPMNTRKTWWMAGYYRNRSWARLASLGGAS